MCNKSVRIMVGGRTNQASIYIVSIPFADFFLSPKPSHAHLDTQSSGLNTRKTTENSIRILKLVLRVLAKC